MNSLDIVSNIITIIVLIFLIYSVFTKHEALKNTSIVILMILYVIAVHNKVKCENKLNPKPKSVTYMY